MGKEEAEESGGRKGKGGARKARRWPRRDGGSKRWPRGEKPPRKGSAHTSERAPPGSLCVATTACAHTCINTKAPMGLPCTVQGDTVAETCITRGRGRKKKKGKRSERLGTTSNTRLEL